mgnify:CR=1 FL=1
MVAAGAIGIPRYFAAAHVIDLIGLTDSTIAHHPQHIPGLKSPAILRKHNTQYVLDRRPDMIFFITGVKPQTAAEKALFLSRRFRQGYYLSHFREGLKAFARRPDYDFGQPDDIFPNTAFVEYYIAGLNALSRDDSTAVVDNFTRCIETGPRDFSYPHLQLGAFYFDNREPARAKPHFARATRIDPYNVGATPISPWWNCWKRSRRMEPSHWRKRRSRFRRSPMSGASPTGSRYSKPAAWTRPSAI